MRCAITEWALKKYPTPPPNNFFALFKKNFNIFFKPYLAMVRVVLMSEPRSISKSKFRKKNYFEALFDVTNLSIADFFS